MNLEPMQLYLYLNPYTYRPKLYGQVTLMWNLVFHFVEHQEEDESFLISAWEEVIKVRRLGSSRERRGALAHINGDWTLLMVGGFGGSNAFAAAAVGCGVDTFRHLSGRTLCQEI
ncbi:hypothetical protein BHE74_00006757 [Ensete ventricosum]|nr:hypothetical protein BHE74_00006757 [Ensete ventricosum]